MPSAKSENLSRYVELTAWIRELSSPQMRDIETAEEYRATLMRNFTRIGELARVNKTILNEHYYPLVHSTTPLSDEDVEDMRDFSQALINAYNLDMLDLPMVYVQAERLVRDAEDKRDDATIIRALDDFVVASYAMMSVMTRLWPRSNVCCIYRDRGLAACERIIAYLEPERFRALPEESKETVLVDSRYIRALYDRCDRLGDPEVNEHDMQTLRRALSLADDPFYKAQAPHYDWEYHRFRAMEYFCSMTELNNERGFSKEQLEEIDRYAQMMFELYEKNEEKFGQVYSRKDIELYGIRSAYLVGRLSKRDYKAKLLDLMARHLDDDFSAMSNITVTHVPFEYILVLDRERISQADQKNLKQIYDNLVRYMHRVPKKDSLSFMLSYLVEVLRTYVETPAGTDFETFCLDLMAAVHPPTYVHTVSVAAFSKCLATRLLQTKPELFVGVQGCETVDQVKERADALIDFVYHAALCHDFGKLMIIDTILTYGRDLLPDEIMMIKAHPEIGADLLRRFRSTARYADVAEGHHKWYDNRGGYPTAFDMERSPDRTVIAIVACADCLDASTDTVGRSYKESISLDHYLSELYAGAGTRYAPYLAELLADKEVRAEVEMLLAKGRDENYRKAYRILEKYDGGGA